LNVNAIEPQRRYDATGTPRNANANTFVPRRSG
jgi:hypothetical protein